MRTAKSIADEALRRKAEAEKTEAEKTEAEKAEAKKVDELVKAVIDQKLAEIEAEAEASKPDELEVHTTKPIEEKPVREKPADQPAVVKKVRVQEKPEERRNLESEERRQEDRRKLNLMPPFSPFERRGQR